MACVLHSDGLSMHGYHTSSIEPINVWIYDRTSVQHHRYKFEIGYKSRHFIGQKDVLFTNKTFFHLKIIANRQILNLDTRWCVFLSCNVSGSLSHEFSSSFFPPFSFFFQIFLLTTVILVPVPTISRKI